MYLIKEVASMADVSVRTLHHYDEKGLLTPSHKTESGYRLYSDEDVEKLQQICYYKELDFSLKEIKSFFEKEDRDMVALLEQHRELLSLKVKRLQGIIKNIEVTKGKYERGETMSNEERFKDFDMSEIEAHKKKYGKEAEEKWGHSDAYAQSKAKTDNYSKEDWARIQEKTNSAYKAIVAMMDRPVSDADVQEQVGKIRAYITEDFYNCTLEIFKGLGEMYVADPRFTKNLDKHGEGFASYLSEAIAYYVTHQ